MDRALIIYDLTGKVWSITYGAEEAPQGVPSLWCDIPPGAVVDYVDVVRGEVVFKYLPETDLGAFQQQLQEIQNYVNNVRGTVDILAQESADAKATAQLAAQNIASTNEALGNVQEDVADASATAQLAAENASSANALAAGNGADITALQEALVEVYEMLIGGEV